MSAFPPGLLAHLQREVTTVCQCWRLVRSDATVLGFTDHDRALVVDGTSCMPGSGFSASEARESLGLAVDTVDIEGALASADLDAEEIAAGRFDGATVETFLVNWRAPDQHALLRRAVIGKITVEDGRFRAELESQKRHLDQPRGRWFRRGCDAELGDARCGVALDQPAFTGAGTVCAVVTADMVEVDGLEAFEPGWFSNGILICLDGPLAGARHRILAHRRGSAADELVIWRDTAPLPPPGTAVTLRAGCDKHFSTCKAKFGNHLNFRGFPHLPGNDVAYGYATPDESFDGSPLVP
ncbi:DUF2163 domain-containing protein [Nitratireductor sp. StC3]|uniref:DUF2163 domain-containing protein n=1 Tax=Nitratireductor sp. StC3 TaxID=2126741 RepID=UPI000D0CA5B6|nr:DUF2163 domain-containing protein [Nitratireductor sp. StC3]PSM18143.1 hypothetical protein C7T96_09695 [Nitratireductor sp. StC3]